MKKILYIIFCVLLLNSCATRVRTIYQEIPIEVKDSLYKSSYEKDSICIYENHLEKFKGDTIYIRDEVKIYKDRIIYDTIRRVDSIPFVITKTEVITEKASTKGLWNLFLVLLIIAFIIGIVLGFKIKR